MANEDIKKENDVLATLSRGFVFVILEQLPEIGSNKLIRKVGILDYARALERGLLPPAPSADISPAEHALGNNRSPFLSASSGPHGSPTNVLAELRGEPLIVDAAKLKARGMTIHSPAEIIADLDRYAATTRDAATLERIKKLKWVIANVEYETLIKGNIPKDAISKPGDIHKAHINSAEQIMRDYKVHGDKARVQKELSDLSKAYGKARITGQAFRVVGVVGVVLTVNDLAKAGVKSIEKGSVKPIVAEGIRQAGGWGAGWLGMRMGCAGGAALGVETGPGAILTCGIGAIFGGIGGYYGADWIADFIDKN